MMYKTAIILLGLSIGVSVSGCHSISEDACMAGRWEDIGFKDGEAGQSRSRLARISERCAKFNVTPDRLAYIRGLELGLQRYCGPSNGYNAGRSGNTPNAECEAAGYVDYLDAFADGAEIHQRERERDDLVRRWEDERTAYFNVTARLEAEDMTAKERRRLKKKAARLATSMDDLRIDIRAMERLYELPRWTAPND